MTQPVLQSRLEQQGDLVLQPFDTSSEHVGKALAALGTRCFMPTLPMPTQPLKQDLRAIQPLGDFNPMTPADIRVQLEQLAATGTASAAEHDRLSQAWQVVKPQTPQSYHPVIEDRLKALKP
jgi:hypothetical protein